MNKRLIIIGAGVAVAAGAAYVGYNMYSKAEHKETIIDPGKKKAAKPGQIGIKGIHFSTKNIETGVTQLTNKSNGNSINIYCCKRKHQEKGIAFRDRDKCVQWKVQDKKYYKRSDAYQHGYRATLE